MSDNPFTRHPHEVGESYGEHMGRHAVFPFLFEHTASEKVRALHRGMARAVDKPNWERHPII